MKALYFSNISYRSESAFESHIIIERLLQVQISFWKPYTSREFAIGMNQLSKAMYAYWDIQISFESHTFVGVLNWFFKSHIEYCILIKRTRNYFSQEKYILHYPASGIATRRNLCVACGSIENLQVMCRSPTLSGD